MFKGSSSHINLKLSTNNTDSSRDSPDSYSHRQRNLHRAQDGRTATGRSIYYVNGDSPVQPKQRVSILEPLKPNHATKLPAISPKSVFAPDGLTSRKTNIFNYENLRISDKRLKKAKNFSEPAMPVKRARIKSTQDTTEKLQPIMPMVRLSPHKSVDIPLINLQVVSCSQIGRRKNHLHKKYNQDQLVIYPHFSDDYRIFGVFDGHGTCGHHVAQKVATILTDTIVTKLQKNQFVLRYDLNFHSTILTEAYHETESQLSKTNINVQLSGSTSNVLLFARQIKQTAKSSKSLFDDTAEIAMETVIYCANLGDSRTIIYGDQITELSIDHKPDDPPEMERIQACGGIVEQVRDLKGVQIGPARVWLPDHSAPGLAMSRSFGDKVAHSVGVTSEPTIKKYVMKHTDQFLVMGSDGIWQYMSNEEVVDIVRQASSPDQAIEDLIRAATDSWHENDFIVDDISCIIVFFNLK